MKLVACNHSTNRQSKIESSPHFSNLRFIYRLAKNPDGALAGRDVRGKETADIVIRAPDEEGTSYFVKYLSRKQAKFSLGPNGTFLFQNLGANATYLGDRMITATDSAQVLTDGIEIAFGLKATWTHPELGTRNPFVYKFFTTETSLQRYCQDKATGMMPRLLARPSPPINAAAPLKVPAPGPSAPQQTPTPKAQSKSSDAPSAPPPAAPPPVPPVAPPSRPPVLPPQLMRQPTTQQRVPPGLEESIPAASAAPAVPPVINPVVPAVTAPAAPVSAFALPPVTTSLAPPASAPAVLPAIPPVVPPVINPVALPIPAPAAPVTVQALPPSAPEEPSGLRVLNPEPPARTQAPPVTAPAGPPASVPVVQPMIAPAAPAAPAVPPVHAQALPITVSVVPPMIAPAAPVIPSVSAQTPPASAQASPRVENPPRRVPDLRMDRPSSSPRVWSKLPIGTFLCKQINGKRYFHRVVLEQGLPTLISWDKAISPGLKILDKDTLQPLARTPDLPPSAGTAPAPASLKRLRDDENAPRPKENGTDPDPAPGPGPGYAPEEQAGPTSNKRFRFIFGGGGGGGFEPRLSPARSPTPATDVPDAFLCSLCMDVLHRPSILVCGHSFCSVCVLQWHVREVRQNGTRILTCPFCRLEASGLLIHDLRLGQIIDRHVVPSLSESDRAALAAREIERNTKECSLRMELDKLMNPGRWVAPGWGGAGPGADRGALSLPPNSNRRLKVTQTPARAQAEGEAHAVARGPKTKGKPKGKAGANARTLNERRAAEARARAERAEQIVRADLYAAQAAVQQGERAGVTTRAAAQPSIDQRDPPNVRVSFS